MADPAPARVIHLIPHMGIGGVEVAAASMARVDLPDLQFRVMPLLPAPGLGLAAQLSALLRGVMTLRRDPPDLLIVSLWRSYLVALILKLLHPRQRIVLFVHSTIEMHLPDRWLTRLVYRLSDAVWADCSASLAARLPRQAQGRIISYRIERWERLPARSPRPDFIFWGRLSPLKRLDRALRIFAGVRGVSGAATLLLIGPDDGQEADLRRLAADLGVADAVRFAGPADPAGIREQAAAASWFLLTSEAEGMAAAVVEAMQLGLVPVVTPVGEVARYARHGENAVVIASEEQAVADIVALLSNPARYAALADRAVAEWQDQPTYREAVLAACRALI